MTLKIQYAPSLLKLQVSPFEQVRSHLRDELEVNPSQFEI